MEPLETSVGVGIAFLLVAVAGYFAWRQTAVLQMLGRNPDIMRDQRRYLTQQSWRRLFGSVVLALMAAMLLGSLFLNYEPLRAPIDQLPVGEQEEAKQAFRFVSFYWMVLLLLVMAVLALAVFDLWATARHGVQQQKRLVQEHHEMLAAELEELRHRHSERNGD